MQRQDRKIREDFFAFFSLYPTATEWSDPVSEADPVKKSYFLNYATNFLPGALSEDRFGVVSPNVLSSFNFLKNF